MSGSELLRKYPSQDPIPAAVDRNFTYGDQLVYVMTHLSGSNHEFWTRCLGKIFTFRQALGGKSILASDSDGQSSILFFEEVVLLKSPEGQAALCLLT